VSFAATDRSRLASLARAGIVAAGLAFAAAAPQVAQAAVSCDRVAAPGGSDSAAGTADAPYATPQKLANVLTAGQTGCLRQGTYRGNLRFGRSGASGAPLTLASYPGERGTVVGRVEIPDGVAFINVTGLTLDRSGSAAGLPSPTINGDDVSFTGNDVTDSHTGICFSVGDQTYGHASRVLIQANRIHGCGILPAANHDHGIYVSDSDNVTISWNLIYENADRGVQLYPNAQHTVVTHNVIDGNGEGILFSGDFGYASSGNVVANNAITNSKLRPNVQSWYPSGNPKGTNNSVTQNCISGSSVNVDTSDGGFTASNNLAVDPGYAGAAGGDYRMPAGSSCASLVGDVAGTVAAAISGSTPTSPPPTTDPVPPPTTNPVPPPTTDPVPPPPTTTKKKKGHRATTAKLRTSARSRARSRARYRRHHRRHAVARLHASHRIHQIHYRTR
jgi:parallel beta-helix repeat protein